jgi:hypothetical protein
VPSDAHVLPVSHPAVAHDTTHIFTGAGLHEQAGAGIATHTWPGAHGFVSSH